MKFFLKRKNLIFLFFYFAWHYLNFYNILVWYNNHIETVIKIISVSATDSILKKLVKPDHVRGKDVYFEKDKILVGTKIRTITEESSNLAEVKRVFVVDDDESEDPEIKLYLENLENNFHRYIIDIEDAIKISSLPKEIITWDNVDEPVDKMLMGRYSIKTPKHIGSAAASAVKSIGKAGLITLENLIDLPYTACKAMLSRIRKSPLFNKLHSRTADKVTDSEKKKKKPINDEKIFKDTCNEVKLNIPIAFKAALHQIINGGKNSLIALSAPFLDYQWDDKLQQWKKYSLEHEAAKYRLKLSNDFDLNAARNLNNDIALRHTPVYKQFNLSNNASIAEIKEAFPVNRKKFSNDEKSLISTPYSNFFLQMFGLKVTKEKLEERNLKATFNYLLKYYTKYIGDYNLQFPKKIESLRHIVEGKKELQKIRQVMIALNLQQMLNDYSKKKSDVEALNIWKKTVTAEVETMCKSCIGDNIMKGLKNGYSQARYEFKKKKFPMTIINQFIKKIRSFFSSLINTIVIGYYRFVKHMKIERILEIYSNDKEDDNNSGNEDDEEFKKEENLKRQKLEEKKIRGAFKETFSYQKKKLEADIEEDVAKAAINIKQNLKTLNKYETKKKDYFDGLTELLHIVETVNKKWKSSEEYKNRQNMFCNNALNTPLQDLDEWESPGVKALHETEISNHEAPYSNDFNENLQNIDSFESF